MGMRWVSVVLSLVVVAACSERVQANVAETATQSVIDLTWEELMPEGEEDYLTELYQSQIAIGFPVEEGGEADVATQFGSFNTVASLEGRRVRLPGYTVPFEYGRDAVITEFLLVPYFGACLHAPPPPPNQTIYVTTSKPIELVDLAQAVWVEGTIRATRQETELADAAYTIEMDVIEVY